MGNKASSEPCALTDEELRRSVEATHFTREEVKALWYHFRSISSLEGSPEFINRGNFQMAMSFRDSFLLDRIFSIFDLNADGDISFPEFLSCLSIISNKASQEEKLKLSFQIYDADGDDLISTNELTSMLLSTLREHDLVITPEEIDEIVEATLKEADVKIAGKIDFEEFQAVVNKTPYVLSHLTLNISGIIAEYGEEHGVSFQTPRP